MLCTNAFMVCSVLLRVVCCVWEKRELCIFFDFYYDMWGSLWDTNTGYGLRNKINCSALSVVGRALFSPASDLASQQQDSKQARDKH
mmetsp:Transcript_22572/g.28941  ORF Transcript_22572/g.28941 Transcript_22572/m.28941 type:complete len:87 (+) Transcript_22572:41-301(+)